MDHVPVPTIVASLISGGLAGAILNLLMVKRTLAKTMRAQSRQDAILGVIDWTNKAYESYWANEAKAGGSSTLGTPQYNYYRDRAAVKMKANFDEDANKAFKQFADWLEKALKDSFREKPFPFDEFNAQRERLV